MRVAENNREARKLIRENKSFKLIVVPTQPFKKLVKRFSPCETRAGIILETGEVIVFTTLIIVCGSAIVYGIYHGFSVKLKKGPGTPWENWYLEFTKPQGAKPRVTH
ncbi:MAG: hypothetical protein ACUZ8E_14130 [Candidatus Anammoxibacter sp.]